MVTFLMVERALVTFTETVTASPNAGDVGLMTGVPITGACDGGACARATEPATKARVKKSIVSLRSRNEPPHRRARREIAQNAARYGRAPNWSLGRGLNPRPYGAWFLPFRLRGGCSLLRDASTRLSHRGTGRAPFTALT